MNVASCVKAFALFAAVVMLSASCATAASSQVVRQDAQARADRFVAAVERLTTEGMSLEAMQEARESMDGLPPELRSSPALRQLEDALTALDDPMVAQMMAPIFESGLLKGTPEEIIARGDEITARLERTLSGFGVAEGVLGPQWEALNASAAGLDVRDPVAMQAQIRAMPDEELRRFVVNLAAFTANWNETANTELTQRVDAIAQHILAQPVSDIKRDVPLDAATTAQYEEAFRLMDALYGDLAPEALLGTSLPETTYSPDWEIYKDSLRQNLSALYEVMGAEDDAFLGVEGADAAVYQGTAGPIAIDGIALPGASPLLASTPGLGLTAPAPSFAPQDLAPVALAARDAHAVSLAPSAPPLLPHAQVASELALPGTPAAGFPDKAWEEAMDMEPREDASWDATQGTQIHPTWWDNRGQLGPGDKADAYWMDILPSRFYRFFLEVPPGMNADLEVRCISTSRSWASYSDGDSDRPGFDSVSFMHNEPGAASNEAFLPIWEAGQAVCPGNRFYLFVTTPTEPTANITYLLRAHDEIYTGLPCSRGMMSDCGLDWARWADRCKDSDRDCKRNHHTSQTISNPYEFSELASPKPVVFVHGVGGVAYNTWVDMESNSYSTIFDRTMVTLEKATLFILAGLAIAVASKAFLNCVHMIGMMLVTSGSLAGAMAGIAVMSIMYAAWGVGVGLIFYALKKFVENWRKDSEDVESHFWTTRKAGYATYWVEYNHNDNAAVEAERHIQRAGWQLKHGINAIQQEFFDRYRGQSGFPYASPEDVKVDLVVHSMGGLVSRWYTAAPIDVPEGKTYVSRLYEADVDKWISLQTPNMGSTPAAKAFATRAAGPDIVGFIIGLAFSFGIASCFGMSGITTLQILWAIAWNLFKNVAFPFIAGTQIKDRDQLIRGRSVTVAQLNSYPPAGDVDYGIIYGIPFNGYLLGLKRFDILVSEHDAKEGSLEGRMATYPISEDHGSALFGSQAQKKILEWLSVDDIPASSLDLAASTDGLPAAEAQLVTAALAPPRRSLLERFGQVEGPDANAEPGARYAPDGGALTTPAPGPTSSVAGGDRTAKLERLAAKKGLDSGVRGFAETSEATSQAVDQLRQDPGNATADDAGAAISAAFHTAMRSPGGLGRASDLAADVGVLRAGHAKDATALLEGLAEPYVLVDVSAPWSELAKRDILLVPTGALSGAGPALGAKLARFVDHGGTLIVLGQARGSDLALLPGAPRGFGFMEEDGAYRDSVVMSAFTPALAGQADATPDVSVDGSLTALPEGASVLLKSAKNGRAVLASYPASNGTVVVSALLSDWAGAASRGTAADAAIVRDLIADARAPAALPLGAPGTEATVRVELGASGAAASSVTLVLVDGGARELRRETLPGSSSYDWAIPAGLTGARHHAVDAILRDAEGNATLRLLDVVPLYAAHFAANPDGFRPALAPALLDVTSASPRAEEGAPFSFEVRVTNTLAEPRELVVGHWFPEHATLTGDLATYGAGAPRAGAPAAWEDNFQLRTPVTVQPGATVVLPVEIPAVLRSDALTARLYGSDGAVLGEARRTFASYVPSVQVNASVDRAHYAAGDTVAATFVARDPGAPAGASSTPASLVATLRAPGGAIVATASGTILVGPAERSTTLDLPIPAGSPAGGYALAVEARRGGERIGSGGATLRVPGAQLTATPALPASFASGEASTVTYTLRNPGVEPVEGASFRVTLTDPAGATGWSAEEIVTLAPGASTELSFDVTPANALPGEHRLAYRADLGDLSFTGERTIRAGASASIAMAKTSWRVREAFAADVTVKNDGLFTLPLSIGASAPGLEDARTSATLAPGGTAPLRVEGVLPAELPAGQHAVRATLTTPDGATSHARTFTLAPARVTLTLPAGSAAAGDALDVRLRNSGGVDASVPWSARLLDTEGREVAAASGEAIVLAGGTATTGLVVPPQARSGEHRFEASAQTTPGRPEALSRVVVIAGTSGTIGLDAPLTAAPGASVVPRATPVSTGVPLEGAEVELTAIRPAPLPAWRGIDGGKGATTAIEHAGALWFGTPDGLVRVGPTGATATIGVADGLPSERVTSLAVARGMLHVGTERGIAWHDGASWHALSDLSPLPTRHVRALAGDAHALYLATDHGVARYDGAALTLVPIPADAATSLALSEGRLWAALADVSNGFVGQDVTPVAKTGSIGPTPAVAVAPDGDVHVVYADNTSSSSFQLLHVRLSADGTPVGAPAVVRSGAKAALSPAVAVDADGDVHVAWEDHRIPSDVDIYYRKLSPDGTPLTPELAIAQHAGTSQRYARLGIGPGGDVYMMWADDRDPNPASGTATRGYDNWFARLDNDGNVLVAPRSLGNSGGHVLIPRFVVDADGDVHAAYTDHLKRCDPEFPQYCYPNLETYYAKWDANGATIHTPRLASTGDDTISYLPGLAVEADGSVSIVYQELDGRRPGMRFSRVAEDGEVLVRDVRLNTHAVQRPQILPRADGMLDVLWVDTRSGRTEAYHNVLDPLDEKLLLAADERVNTPSAGSGGYQVVNGFSLHVATSPTGQAYAVWEDMREPGVSQWRLAFAATRHAGRGVAGLSLEGAANETADRESGLLPSDDVGAVAAEGSLSAFVTDATVTFHDAKSGAWWSVPAPGARAPLALHRGLAYVATSGATLVVDPHAEDAIALPAGGPGAARALASVEAGVVVANVAAAALLVDDREDRFGTIRVPAAHAVESSATLELPEETGRYTLRATLLAATGQPLAKAERSLFVLDGDLAVTIAPARSLVAAGENLPIVVTVGNRGAEDLSDVRLTLDAGSARLLDARTPLAAGEARSYTVTRAAAASYALVAQATATTLALAAPPLAARAEDHVEVARAALAVAVVAPDVASREPFAVGALLTNRGLLPLDVDVALEGGASQAVRVPAKGRILVEELGTRAIFEDTLVRVQVTGSAVVGAERLVVAGERAAFVGATGAAGPAGARVVSLAFEARGPLATSFPVALRLDDVPLADPLVTLAPGGRTTLDVALDLTEGLHTLAYATPWETGEVRIAASDAPIPVVTIGEVATSGGNATSTLRVENAGPGRLVGVLELDHGFLVTSVPLDLDEGASLEHATRAPLAGVAPGATELRARVQRDGALLAQASRAFDVPGPRLVFDAVPADLDVIAGQDVTLSYTVRNVGEATGPAEVRLAVGGADALARTVTLAPQESAQVSFDTRIEQDARDGTLAAVASVPGAEAVSALRVTGARVAAVATLDAARYEPHANATLSLDLTSLSATPLALVVTGSLGQERQERALTLAPGASQSVPLVLAAHRPGEARWSVALASGRILAEGAERVVLDTLATDGVRVSTDVAALAAGGQLAVTVTTTEEGRVDLLGPGFRDEFVLNGTQTRTYLVPADVQAGRYSLFWNFDATNASGTIPLAVRGHEVSSLGLRLTDAAGAPLEAASIGQQARASWIVRSALPADVAMRAWIADATGSVRATTSLQGTLAAGDNLLEVSLAVPDVEPGAARLHVALDLPTAREGIPLAEGSEGFTIRGFSLRDARIELEDDDTFVLRLEAASATPVEAPLSVLVSRDLAHEGTWLVDGVAEHAVAFVAPEPGVYEVRVTLDAPEGRIGRDLRAEFPGTGTPPVTTLAYDGLAIERADGVMVLAPTTRLLVSATDEGSGVATIVVEADADALDADEPILLGPGHHNITLRAVDKAGNREVPRTIAIVVDALAPALVVADPRAGDVHVLGEWVGRPPGEAVAVDPALLPPLPADLVDQDGDGHLDAEETIEGSDPQDGSSVPARYMPAPAPAFERPVIALGAVRVELAATDEGAGVARLAVLLDEREVAATPDASGVWTVDLTGEPAGDHVLTLLATDHVGNVATQSVRVQLVPTTSAGILATDPNAPRLHPFAPALHQWLLDAADALPGALEEDAARREARAVALQQQVDREIVQPLTPTVVDELPGQVQRDVDAIAQAVEDIVACCAPG